MISWGTKYDPIGEYNDLPDEACKICSQDGRPRYKVEQAYFTLYGLPLFKTRRQIYKTCDHCNAKLKAKKDDPNVRSVKLYVKSPFKFKYFWGWIVPLILLLLVLSFIM